MWSYMLEPIDFEATSLLLIGTLLIATIILLLYLLLCLSEKGMEKINPSFEQNPTLNNIQNIFRLTIVSLMIIVIVGGLITLCVQTHTLEKQKIFKSTYKIEAIQYNIKDKKREKKMKNPVEKFIFDNSKGLKYYTKITLKDKNEKTHSFRVSFGDNNKKHLHKNDTVRVTFKEKELKDRKYPFSKEKHTSPHLKYSNYDISDIKKVK